MSTAVRERPVHAGARNGGVPARRAVIRWAWRLFRREWRQQMLVLALIIVAVAATIIGAAVATNTPPPAGAGFGTATDQAVFQAPDPHLASQIAALQHRFGRVDVIENQSVAIPGSINTYQLRAQSPHGPFGQPMLSVVSGRFPAGPGEVAVTAGVASDFSLHIGSVWHQGGTARRVVGIVQNPQSLLDEFALVAPGQVRTPTEVTVLFDAPRVGPSSLGRNVISRSSAVPNAINPQTISITALTVGMLLIALVAVGGFTVLAQRRLRSLGMLASLGATDRHVRLVVRANGVVVGIVGALLGGVAGLGFWLAYRPILEANAHHLIGVFSLPWLVIVLAMVLAVVAAYFAAARPARAIARVPVVTALSGRPPMPKQVRRSALPGLVLLAAAFVLLGFASTSGSTSAQASTPELAIGIILLIVATILLAPFALATTARLGKHAPIAIRLALRDLARYRARSGSALAAISIGILIAVIVSVAAAARFANVLDYAGPNLASNQLIVYAPGGPYGPSGPGTSNGSGPATPPAMTAQAHRIAAALGAKTIVQLDTTTATLQHAAAGRNWAGPLYVATPQLLHAFGIKASQVSPAADILTMRPGLSGISKMQLVYSNYFNTKAVRNSYNTRAARNNNGPATFPCPRGVCVANPAIQEISALPSGTSAPNSVITEHAVQTLHLRPFTAGWLIQAPQPLTTAQIHSAQVTAGAANLSIETKSSVPTSAEIINWATVFGIGLALAILAMSIGLIRSETASDLRTLAATGASGRARRTLAATTAGALALLGAVLGTVGGYIGVLGYFRTNSFNGGIGAIFSTVPVQNLLIILVGMPLVAAVGGWLLAGREPRGMTRQPIG
jgi:putative ABC transport system permease protein